MVGLFDDLIGGAEQSGAGLFDDLKPEPDGAFKRGWNKATNAMAVSANVAIGDNQAAAERLKVASDYNAANPGSQESQELMQAWETGEGVSGAFSSVGGEIAKDWREASGLGGKLKSAWDNTAAVGEILAEQTGNMVAPLAGMGVGHAAGRAVGTPIGAGIGAVVGAPAGGVGAVPGAGAGGAIGGTVGGIGGSILGGAIGNAAQESGYMALGDIQEAGIDPGDADAVRAYLDENSGRLLKQGATKGAIIATVDRLTMGVASKLLNGPLRDATNRALAKMGVDAADKAAVKAATQSSDFAAHLAGDAAYQSSKQGAERIARNMAAFAVDPAGEFTGEFVGTGVATGEWNAKDATLEAVMGLGQSGVMYAGQKAYQAATGIGRGAEPMVQPQPTAENPAPAPVPAPDPAAGPISRTAAQLPGPSIAGLLPDPGQTLYGDSQGNVSDQGPARNVDREYRPTGRERGPQTFGPGMDQSVPMGEPAPLEGQLIRGGIGARPQPAQRTADTFDHEPSLGLPAPGRAIPDMRGDNITVAPDGTAVPGKTPNTPPAPYIQGGPGMDQQREAGKTYKGLPAANRAIRESANPDQLEAVKVGPQTFEVRPKAAEPEAPRPVLQNRDRSTPASITQMRSIAARPDYQRVSISRDFANGAPVVEPGAAVPSSRKGRTEVVSTASDRKIRTQYAVIEASDLLPSHDINGSQNTEYATGAKGKSRAIAGNGRVTGISHAYAQGTAGEYRRELEADAAGHGISPEAIKGMKQPVLVRIMPQDQITQDIGDESNTATVSALSAAEQARNDAARIDTASMEFDDNGEISEATVRQFIQSMPEAERGGLLDGGRPSRQAYDRAASAVFASAYESDELIRLQAQATDPEARTVLAGLLAAASKMARLKGQGQWDIRGLVVEAAQAAVNATRNGQTLAAYAEQFDIERNPEATYFIDLFAANSRSGKRIGEQLSAIADTFYAEASKSEFDMFGAVPRRSRQELLGELNGTAEGQPSSAQPTGQQAGPGAAAADEQARDAERAEPAGAGADAQAEAFQLNQQTEEELAAADAANKARIKAEEKAQAEAEQKAQADRDRNDFTLTGSDRPSDVAAARGQNDMFAPPTRGEKKASEVEIAPEGYPDTFEGKSELLRSSPELIAKDGRLNERGARIVRTPWAELPNADKTLVRELVQLRKSGIAARNADVLRQEAEIERRQLEGEREIRAANGKPFKSQQAVEKLIAGKGIQDSHAPQPVEGGWVARRRSAAEQLERDNAARGIEPYTEVQARVIDDMGLRDGFESESLSEDQYVEIEARVAQIMRQQRKDDAARTESAEMAVRQPIRFVSGQPASEYLADGSTIEDGNGQQYRVHYQRNDLVVAHPIIDGKAQVNADSSVRFHVGNPESADGRRTDPIYLVKDRSNAGALTDKAAGKPKKQKEKASASIEDAGEKLGGARKDQLRSVRERLDDMDDEAIAGSSLSQLWPKGELDKITDPFEAALYHVVRGLIPAKPRVPYRVKAWVGKVKAARDILTTLGGIGADATAEKMRAYSPGLGTVADQIEVLMALDRKHWGRIDNVRRATGRYNQDGKMVPGSWVNLNIDGRQVSFYGHESVASAIPAIKDRVEGKDAPEKRMKFAIYTDRQTGDVFVVKEGDAEMRRLKTFKSVKEARAFLNDEYEAAVALWDAVKNRDNVTKSDMRRATNEPRVGQDHRDGKDVTPEQFLEAFGFRGVEFGNWVKQGAGGRERQGMLNDAYDAFMDLAGILNIPPKALSLEGKLGIGFGSRGSGKASAHYEPDLVVINMTKTKGAGTLAHEWFHALDNYFARRRAEQPGSGIAMTDRETAYITYRPERLWVNKKHPSMRMTRSELSRYQTNHPGAPLYQESNWEPDAKHPNGVRPQVEKAFAELVATLNASPMLQRAKVIDGKTSDGYWSRIIERGARSFETYVIARLADQGFRNDYLANVQTLEQFSRDPGRYPYLTPDEQGPVNEAFDKLFATLETKETDLGVALFSPRGSYTIGQADQQFVNEPTATESGYETDLFGNPIPAPRGRAKAARSAGAGVRGDVQPASTLSDTPTPAGRYHVKTIVGSEVSRQLGADRINSFADLAQATQYLYRSAVERFDGIVTDKDGKPLAVVGGFKGAIDSASVPIAPVIAEAVRVRGAANIWLSHNHPSGLSELSSADRNLHRAFEDAFAGSGIEVRGLIAVGRGEYEATDYTNGSIPAEGNTVRVPVIEREQVGEPLAVTIESPAAARAVAAEYYEEAGRPGMILLDTRHRVTGWAPFTPGMTTGALRNTGGLNALYRAVSEGNVAAAILVHGGELDTLLVGAHDSGMNIAAGLDKANVRVLDVINATTKKSRAEAGSPIVGHALYRLSEPGARGIPLFSARAIAKKVMAATGLNATVVNTEADLPADLQAQIKRDKATGRVAGVYHNGTAYLVASNLRDAKHAVSVMLHEAVGHGGVKSVLGGNIGKVMAGIYRDMPAAIRKELERRYASQIENLSEADANVRIAEEYVAHLAETDPQHSVISRLVARLRQFIRDTFGDSMSMKWTRNDLVLLLADARVAARSQGAVDATTASTRYSLAQTATAAFKRLSALLGSGSAARDMMAADSQTLINSLERDAEAISNFLERKPFGSKSSGSIDIPSSVVPHVLSVTDNEQVLGAIVRSIPVDVMDFLGRKELSPEHLLRDQSMLEDVFSVNGQSSVSLGINKAIAGSLMRAVADTTAEIASLAGRSLKGDSAGLAGANNSVLGAQNGTSSNGLGGKKDTTKSNSFLNWFGDSKVVDAEGRPLFSRPDLVASRKAAIFEGGVDSGASDAKPIADLLVSKAFSLKGLGGLEIPAQRKVLHGVLALGDDLKILRSVVDLVPVDVMNILERKNLSPETLFRDEAVLKELLSADRDGSVTMAIDIADALIGAVARMAAEGPPVDAWMTAPSGKRNSASRAGVDDSFHDQIVGQIKATDNNGDFDPNNPDIRYSLNDDIRDLFNRATGPAPLDRNDPFAEENRRLRENEKTLWNKAKKVFARQFAPGGLLPESVFNEKIARDSEFQAVEFDVRHLSSALGKAVKADFGVEIDSLTAEQMKSLAEALAGKVDPTIPEATKVAIVAMRQYIDSLSGEYLDILQEQVEANMQGADQALIDKITGNLGAYVNRSYQAFDDPKWFKKVPTEVVNTARAYLANGYMEQGETAAEARRLADVTVNEMLKNGTAYDSMGAFIAEGKLGAKDLTVLIKRKEIAPEIRALLGEYLDPRLNFAKSATKMGRLVWNQRFLDRVLEFGMGTLFFEGKNRPAEATTQIAGEQSETYAPLNGLWTTPEIAQAFKDALGKEQMSDLYRTVVRLNGMVKYGKTVLSPTTAMRNWQSAMFFSLANGHFDLTQMKQSWAAFREQVTQNATGDDLSYLRKLKKLGVVYDTPYAGEMMALLQDARMDELLSSKSGKGLKWLRKANQFAQGFYSFGDDFWKIIGFENEKASLIAAGIAEAEAEVMAAKRIRDTYPTYSMIGRGVQWLRRFPLAGTFVSFPSEIIRTTVNMFQLVSADLKSDNPKIRELGRKRALGMVMVSGGFYALAALSAAAAGVGDDEEEALRDLAAPWSKNSTFLYTGRDDDGKLRYFDMSFLDPYGYWKRPLTAMMRDQPWEQAAVSGLSDMLSPFFGADITAGAIFEVLANKKPTGGTVFNPDAGSVDQLQDITNHMRKALQPGFVSNGERLWLAGTEARREGSGQPYVMRDELVSLLGWRASTLDTQTGLYYRSFDFTDGLANAKKTLTRTLRSSNDVSDDDIREAKESANAQYQRAFTEMGRLVRSAQSAGMSRTEVVQTLRLSGVAQRNIFALMNGRIPPIDIGIQAQAKAVQQAVVMRDREHGAEIARRFRLAREE